ncbi:phosphatidylinositol-4-phosphate 5-kinase family protein [Babesia bovis T2Bo]|uniref:1-phosphatidylinositol-3-phosphate 5-kinase n=1 Tax=Babesia bovis TaxID=5865 RepID=A7AQ09_BABBO|nr:phosphatidylinositol-4-phosphate 5-kinase family protein [Babesia bovis T2Bo]EDO08643.1 phosphatidylinositol-4-phosphate 5-kinase family protein [Babesia bovis T2Bo]|eukprot:XP_001612211.1 phosphatidylinositol-4-phosphate 5-kinase family protein [Babesia bovis T2Bo]
MINKTKVVKPCSKSSREWSYKDDTTYRNDTQSSDSPWYEGIFQEDDFWHSELLDLVSKYIRHHIYNDNTALRLSDDVADYIGNLLLRYGFRAKQKHGTRDIIDTVKILPLPYKLHSLLKLDTLKGISLFNGLCIQGRLAHPRMYKQLDRLTVLLTHQFLSFSDTINSNTYEDISDVRTNHSYVDYYVEQLCNTSVKLVICTGNLSLEVAEKLHLRGICCLCNVSREEITQLSLAIGAPVLPRIAHDVVLSQYIAYIGSFQYIEQCGFAIGAIRVGPCFHGCTVIYSRLRLLSGRYASIRDLMQIALWRIQLLFDELQFVKILGGGINLNTALNLLKKNSTSLLRRSAIYLDHNYTGNTPSCANEIITPLNSTVEINEQCMNEHVTLTRHPTCSRLLRIERLFSLIKGRDIDHIDMIPQKAPFYIHFSNWVSDYLLGTTSNCSGAPQICDIQHMATHAVIKYYEYSTRSNEMCGSVVLKALPVGSYARGMFLNDFVGWYTSTLDQDVCITSEQCNEQMSNHTLHLETVEPMEGELHKRLSMVVTRKRNYSSTRMHLSSRCKECNDEATVDVPHITFGNFVYLLLHNGVYTAGCGHPLFGSHSFRIQADKVTICLHVQEVQNYKVGAWLDINLLNANLGNLSLGQAGATRTDQRLIRCGEKLRKLHQTILNTCDTIDTDNQSVLITDELSDTQCSIYEHELDLLNVRNLTPSLDLAVKHLFSTLCDIVETRFQQLISVDDIQHALPCRCEVGATYKNLLLDSRNQWATPFKVESISDLDTLWKDRNSIGQSICPRLRDQLSNSIGKGYGYSFCHKCHMDKFNSIAELEVVNWIYTITATVRSIGVNLKSMIENLRGNMALLDVPNDVNSTSLEDVTTSSHHSAVKDVSNSPAFSIATWAFSAASKSFSGARSPSMVLTLNRENTKDLNSNDMRNPVDTINDIVERTLDNIRLCYIQVVAHLIFGVFWSSPDSMDIYTTVRSFVVSLTSLCRQIIGDVMKSPVCYPYNKSRLLDSNIFIDDANIELNPSLMDAQMSSARKYSHPMDSNIERSRHNISYRTSESMDAVNEVNGYIPENTVSLDNILPLGQHKYYVVWGLIFAVNTRHHNSQTHDSEVLYPSISRSFSREIDTDQQKDDLLTITETLRRIWNSSTIGSFRLIMQGRSVDSVAQLLSRMHDGCPKLSESVVAVRYGMLPLLRRDIGSLISAALMSQEYMEECVSNFVRPIKHNWCTLGKRLLDYTRNRRYCYLRFSNVYVDFEMQLPKRRMLNARNTSHKSGLMLNFLIFRYVKRSSHLFSFCSSAEPAIIDNDWTHRDMNKHKSRFCFESVVQNDIGRTTVSLLSYWQIMYFVINKDKASNRTTNSILCPVTYPSYGTPIIICNSRLWNYKWCSHEKDYYKAPVMDHIVKGIMNNIIDTNKQLKAYIEWTCQYLEESIIRMLDTNAIVAHSSVVISSAYGVKTRTGEPHHIEKTAGTPRGSCRVARSYGSQPDMYLHMYRSKRWTFQRSISLFMGNHQNDLGLESPANTMGTHGKDTDGQVQIPTAVEVNCPIYGGRGNAEWNNIENRHYDTRTTQHITQTGIKFSGATLSDTTLRKTHLWIHNANFLCPEITLSSINPNYTVVFHHPEAFHNLRHLFCADDLTFARSLSRTSKLRSSGGKSGAPLYVSCDGKFMIKHLNRHEFQLLIDRAPRFFEHIFTGGTLLSIPYGLVSLIHKRNGSVARLLIMQYVDHSTGSRKLTFDMKGVAFKRSVSVNSSITECRPPEGSTRSRCCSFDSETEWFTNIVMLDYNFKNYTRGSPIRLAKDDVARIFEYLRRDLEFLSMLEVVDYSILLQICPSEGVMVLGIIDFLRPYTWDKQIESIGKKLANLAIGQEPTIVSPLEYRARFFRFISRIIWHYNEETISNAVDNNVKEIDLTKPTFNCRCSFCATTKLLYTNSDVKSLSHYMMSTSISVRKYIQSLVSNVAPAEDRYKHACQVVAMLQENYETAAICPIKDIT